MKSVKKISSLLLALLLMFSLAVPALAAQEGTLTDGKITISNAVPGQNYSIYQILYLESYDSDSGAYSYKANSAWEAWLRTKNAYVSFDAQGYVTWVEGADVVAFAKEAQEKAKTLSHDGTATCAADSTSVEFTGLKLGYYLVDTTLGTLCSIDTTNPTVTIQEKNGVPENVKQVQEDSTSAWGNKNDADIGQTVNFHSTITAQPGAENYVFHDTMSSGLNFTAVTGITLNEETVAEANYTVNKENLSDNCTFEVVFTQDFCNGLKADDKIVISYTAVLNENAVIAGNGNPNESKLSYGDSSNTKTTPVSTTTTYTWDMDVFKYTLVKSGDEQTEQGLAGAEFTLSKSANGSDPIALINKGNNTYRIAKDGEEGSVTTVTTDATGRFTIEGLDSDTYYLTETKAPNGYNVLSSAITVVIADDGTVTYTYNGTAGTGEVKVLNQSGTELPSTGGMGTTVLYIIGSVLVLAAAVLLITRKRMSAEA